MESVIGAVNFLLMPLTFVSSIFMAQELMPHWMQVVARFNPVNWAVEAGRAAAGSSGDWGLVLTRAGYLLILGLACGWFATRVPLLSAFHLGGAHTGTG
jgi:ABC-2 type transport system permease protein